MTYEQLKAQGVKVKVNHLRLVKEWPDDDDPPPASTYHIKTLGLIAEAQGGTTSVVIELPNGKTFSSWARCSPLDNYDRKRGREIAFGRAWKLASAEYPVTAQNLESLKGSLRETS